MQTPRCARAPQAFRLRNRRTSTQDAPDHHQRETADHEEAGPGTQDAGERPLLLGHEFSQGAEEGAHPFEDAERREGREARSGGVGGESEVDHDERYHQPHQPPPTPQGRAEEVGFPIFLLPGEETFLPLYGLHPLAGALFEPPVECLAVDHALHVALHPEFERGDLVGEAHARRPIFAVQVTDEQR